MLRPIDTQTVYQQTQEVASREQLHKQAELLQQDQFSNLLKKEVNNKLERVNELQKGERVDNDLNKSKKNKQENNQQEKHQKKNSTSSAKKQGAKKQISIDIRI